MKAAELIAELKRRNHPKLFHACTLGTFRSYCQRGAYRSRFSVEATGLPLTPQVSDDEDARLGILDHLFLNIYDQHGDVHKGRSVTGLNKYGPILMVFDVDSLARYQGEIKGYKREITAGDYSPAVHDVVTLDDFRQNTFKDARSISSDPTPRRQPGTPGPNMCIHGKEENGGIPFKPYLVEVIVDTFPVQLRTLQETVATEVRYLLDAHSPHTKMTQRRCIDGCDCEYGYGTVLSREDVVRFIYETNKHVYAKRLRRP